MLTVRTRRFLLWIALPLAILIGLYAVLGFVAVPRLLRSGAQDFVTQHYHRQLRIGEIRFNPFTLRLDVRDLSLPDADGQPMLSFGHLLVDATLASIWRRGPDFETILLEQPMVHVSIRRDGTLNLSDLAIAASPDAKPHPEADQSPARLFINHFAVQAGNLAFDDQAHPSEFRAEIKPIAFELQNFSTVGAKDGSYSLQGMSEAGERFKWSGSIRSYPLASHGQFEVAGLQARTIWNYLRDSVHFELPTGSLSLNGDYDFTAATNPSSITVNVHDITVQDLSVRPKGGAEDYIKVPNLVVHETRADIVKRTVAIGGVHMTGAEVRAWVQAPGTINLLELTGAASAPPATPEPAAALPPPPAPAVPTAPSAPTEAEAPAAAPWTVAVPDIALDAMKISLEDRQVRPNVAVRLADLNVHVTGFNTARINPVAATLSTQINQGGKLEVKAELSPDLAAVKAQAGLTNLDLTVLQPYIAQRTAMTMTSGNISTQLQLERGADGELTVSGDAQLAKFRTIDNILKRDFIKFDRLEFAGIQYRSKPASLNVKAINARGPYARVIVESDRTVNVAKVLAGPGGPAPAAEAKPVAESQTVASSTPKAAAKPAPGGKSAAKSPANSADSAASQPAMAITVGAINVQDGSANYADFWIQPHFAVGIQALNGYVRGISSNPSSRAKVELQGKVDRYAPVHIWGETNPLAATKFTDIKMTFKGVELTSATPYSGRFAGYKIEKGKLSVDIGYRIENRQLTAQHRVVIDQLELGDRVESADAIKLPLKLAIALLKDRNGVIDLDLPITGTLDDPQFKLGPLIWKVIVNVFEKVATAPFAALGRLFGGGEQMNFIDFRPGSAELDAAARDKLTALIKALKEKDKLELDVPVTYSPELDGPGLAAAHLDRRLVELQTPAPKHRASPPTPSAATSVPPPNASPAAPAEVAATDPTITDPVQRFHLLVLAYRADLGKDTALPESAQAATDALKKKGPLPDLSTANTDLEGALLQKITVGDAELERLGKHRAQAIQDVLLGGGEIDPSRVFVIGTKPKAATEKDKVRVELALK